jgi:hypothetical protein
MIRHHGDLDNLWRVVTSLFESPSGFLSPQLYDQAESSGVTILCERG